ncbi:MAG: phenylalanine--tRNA ligase subunit beta, partial [Alistipes sp.]|nr:phenylalanine--tRNA ligase subunit beta [Alistipes sp.]
GCANGEAQEDGNDVAKFVLNGLVESFNNAGNAHEVYADKIEGGKIVVRSAVEGEKFVTLDGVERTLTAADLMICSAERPMCIAGVYGGLDSGITDDTVNVFIESAYFHPVWVRKTAKRFGLNTDASFRFERGIDPNMQVYALKRAAMLMKELAGGTITSEIIDINPTPASHFEFDFSLERARKLIGKDIPEDTFMTILEALDVEVRGREGEVLHVAVPPYRVDVQREADLVEDVLRVYGYNNIEVSDHVNSTLSYAPKPDKARLQNIASDFLAANGYTEIMSNSLTKGAYYEGCTSYPAERCVKILNPLSQDLNVMRQTLMFNALEAVELNVNRRNANLRMFEVGNCYAYAEEKASEDNTLAKYEENYRIGITVTGLHTQLAWNTKAEQSSFFTLRGMVERLLKRFGIDIYALQSESLDSDLYADAIVYKQGPKEVLRMGVVSPIVRKKFDIKQEVYFAEIDFDQLVKMTKKAKVQFKELSKFPEVKRDLALLVNKSVTFSELRAIAFATEKKLLKSVSLFDVYEGDKLPEGKKSYALSFILEDKNQTLTDKQIERTMANLQTQLEQKAGAEVRK